MSCSELTLKGVKCKQKANKNGMCSIHYNKKNNIKVEKKKSVKRVINNNIEQPRQIVPDVYKQLQETVLNPKLKYISTIEVSDNENETVYLTKDRIFSYDSKFNMKGFYINGKFYECTDRRKDPLYTIFLEKINTVLMYNALKKNTEEDRELTTKILANDGIYQDDDGVYVTIYPDDDGDNVDKYLNVYKFDNDGNRIVYGKKIKGIIYHFDKSFSYEELDAIDLIKNIVGLSCHTYKDEKGCYQIKMNDKQNNVLRLYLDEDNNDNKIDDKLI